MACLMSLDFYRVFSLTRYREFELRFRTLDLGERVWTCCLGSGMDGWYFLIMVESEGSWIGMSKCD